VVFFSAGLLAGCASVPPTIGGAPGAPPQPSEYWTPPRDLGTAETRAPLTPVSAPTSAPAATRTLSLADAVDLALRNNPATHISWTQARAAADLYGVSRGSLYPLVSVSGVVTRSRAASPLAGIERSQYGPAVNLSYLVLDFGGRSGSIEVARQTAIAADYSHNVTVQNTILQVEAAAFSFLANRALRDAERSALEEATANLASAEERHRVGLATIADVLQARTAQAQEELNLETLEGQVLVARGTLAAAMGLPANAAFDVPEVPAPDSASVSAVAQSVDTLIDVAVRSRPDLSAARAEAAQAAAQIRVARSASFPALNFSATGGYLGADVSSFAGRNYTLNFGLSMPVFTGFANQYALRAAGEQFDAANARTEFTRQQIVLQVFTSYYALQTATERVRTSANLLASAEESERVARGRYTEGVGSIVDLLIAQSALASARAQAVSARWQWRSALAQLAHDAGVLGIHGESLIPLGKTPGGPQ
jgi:outer membrane protein